MPGVYHAKLSPLSVVSQNFGRLRLRSLTICQVQFRLFASYRSVEHVCTHSHLKSSTF